MITQEIAFFSTLPSLSSTSSNTSSNDTDITWHPGTWIRRPLDCLFFNEQINLYYHHAIAINDEYIIEVGVVDETDDENRATKRALLLKQGCYIVIKAYETFTDITVPKHVRYLIEEYCLMTGQCCVSRIDSKKGWQIYRQPKSFCDGIIIVKRALDDFHTGIKYDLTNNNCESYVNKWWNNRLISHQSKSAIKWGGLVFLGFILSTFSLVAKKGYGHKKKECDAAKKMYHLVRDELRKEGVDTAALDTASNNITRVLYFYIYTNNYRHRINNIIYS